MSTDSEGLGPYGTEPRRAVRIPRRRFDASFPAARRFPAIHAANEAQAANAEIVRTAGADGVFLIHQGSCDELLTMHAVARARYPEWWIGVNCLGSAPARRSPAPVKMSTASGPTMQASMNGTMSRPALSWKFLAEHRGERLEWASLRRRPVKYQRPVEDLNMQPASPAITWTVITTSGPGTGQAADPDKAAAVPPAGSR